MTLIRLDVDIELIKLIRSRHHIPRILDIISLNIKFLGKIEGLKLF